MKDKEGMAHALYDIHEYADLLLQYVERPREIELAELILDRVDFICKQPRIYDTVGHE